MGLMMQGLLALFLFLTAGIHMASTSDDHRKQNPPVNQVAPVKEESASEKKIYNAPPEMKIDTTKSYQAVVSTNQGDFTIDLFADVAPKTVNNFVFLAREGFYEDIVFHRIIQSFMIQTGDPTGTGSGGPGYKFEDELNSNLQYEPGVVAMANAGRNTNGSQIFICTGEDSRSLNKAPNYTIFGKVTSGMDTVLNIAGTKVSAQKSGEVSHPIEKIVINSVSIIEKDQEAQ
jgi:cyclophilin family peptidyl-prolyl cis-trans isomerase